MVRSCHADDSYVAARLRPSVCDGHAKKFSRPRGHIESELGQPVESGHLFLFFNRRRDRVKILFFTGDGLMILYRLLERGTFETPRGWRDQSPKGASSNSQGIELRMSDLALILEGIDLASVKRRKRWRRDAVSA
jgi:transposase